MSMTFTKENATDITVFLLRVVSAVIFIQAGGLKLFGWFGGMPEGMALTPLITVAAILEVFGGAAILLGLFTRPVAFILLVRWRSRILWDISRWEFFRSRITARPPYSSVLSSFSSQLTVQVSGVSTACGSAKEKAL